MQERACLFLELMTHDGCGGPHLFWTASVLDCICSGLQLHRSRMLQCKLLVCIWSNWSESHLSVVGFVQSSPHTSSVCWVSIPPGKHPVGVCILGSGRMVPIVNDMCSELCYFMCSTVSAVWYSVVIHFHWLNLYFFKMPLFRWSNWSSWKQVWGLVVLVQVLLIARLSGRLIQTIFLEVLKTF